jgi:chloramphenicol-sensitive protein RarD
MTQVKDKLYATWLAIAAYVIWGLFPIYWKMLQEISALQLVCHRIVWTCVALVVVIVLSGQWKSFTETLRVPGVLRIYIAAAVLMCVNWFVFTLAVNSGHVTQTGLGYYISPLVNVTMGVVLLGERLRAMQWTSVALAASGVVYLTVSYGAVPWMALALAFSFGMYGLIKKIAPLNAIQGLMLETAILLPPALIYLLYCQLTGQGTLINHSAALSMLLVSSGLVSMSPLLLFAFAARRIPLSRLGILQYITPTMQLLLGIWLYHEPFSHRSLIGYSVVWAALLIFAVDGLIGRSSPLKRPS